MMEILVLKTNEIGDEQWVDINIGFNIAFNRTTTVSYLKKYYTSTLSGYSYHALAINQDKKVIGSNVITPMPYNFGKLVLGYSGGTYILKEYRNDISLLRRMLALLEQYCSKEGIIAFLAVPNKNSLIYFTRIANYKLITSLHYNILPVRLSAIIKVNLLFFFDVFSISFAWILISLNYCLSLLINLKVDPSKYELFYDKTFYQKRFFQEHYTHIEKGNFECYYRIVSEGSINTAYILEFRYKGLRSLKALAVTSYYILSNTKSDIIIFIGHLRLKQFLLFRVPSKLEPQPLPLVYKLTDPIFSQHYEPMSSANNWNFSLINFDAR
jgi:hypothetical protein